MGATPSIATTTQIGNENHGSILQTSQSAWASITQTGDNNLATITQ